MENTGREILQNYPVMNKRRWQIDAIISLVMGEIEDVLPDDARREIYCRLRNLMDVNGFHIMTDADRAALGLEPMDPHGWTMTDRMKEKERQQAEMLYMMRAVVALKTTTP